MYTASSYRPGMQSSFFNNVGATCGAPVNVSSATGVVDFQSNEVKCFTEPCSYSNASGPPPCIIIRLSTSI